MKYEFKYDDIADILWIKSPEMERKHEVKQLDNMIQIHYDRFTKKVIGARLTAFSQLLNDKFGLF